MAISWERSADTETVLQALRGVNDEISWIALIRQTGLTKKRLMSVLASARRILKGEKILFENIHGEGLKRCTDADKAHKPAKRLLRVTRAMKRELSDLATIENFGAMAQTDQHLATTYRITCNAIA